MKKEKEISDYLKADFPFDVFRACGHSLQMLNEFIYSGAWRKHALPNKARTRRGAGERKKRTSKAAPRG